MTDVRGVTDDEQAATREAGALSPRAKVAVLAVVVVALVLALALRGGAGNSQLADTDSGSAAAGADPVLAYEEALQAGRPIFVLFHSSTCPSCVEIERAAGETMPDYAGDVTFVDVLVDDPRAQPLLGRFPFQYIPTSFFLDAEGEVVDQFTGPLGVDDLRVRLDSLMDAASVAPAGEG